MTSIKQDLQRESLVSLRLYRKTLGAADYETLIVDAAIQVLEGGWYPQSMGEPPGFRPLSLVANRSDQREYISPNAIKTPNLTASTAVKHPTSPVPPSSETHEDSSDG